eukprot:12897771-Prorocentrum_lima.AAC.1
MSEGSPSLQPRKTIVAGLAHVLPNSTSVIRVGVAARTVSIGVQPPQSAHGLVDQGQRIQS